jgi:hypothetical protein
MQLTRRDALSALAAAGVAVGAGAAVLSGGDRDANSEGDRATGEGGRDTSSGTANGTLTDHERETLVAVARVVYPSAVTGVETFVETYVDGRTSDRQGYVSGVGEAVRRLDALGKEWHGSQFVDLDPGIREQLLRETGAETAEPAPEGSPAERIRHYLVNELLFALYSSPTGGELVGIENPQGHPGGLASYQRGPSQT